MWFMYIHANKFYGFFTLFQFWSGEGTCEIISDRSTIQQKIVSVHIQQNILHIYNLYTILNITQYSVHKFLVWKKKNIRHFTFIEMDDAP